VNPAQLLEMDAMATPKEIRAAAIAHDLRDGEWVEVGANLPVARAGALLAHLTHGPDMTLMIAMTKACLRDEPVHEKYEYITDVGAMRWAKAYHQHHILLSQQSRRVRGVFFCGGVQIDSLGIRTSSASARTIARCSSAAPPRSAPPMPPHKAAGGTS
jgi:glutaconate CoA-transferase subunit B